MKNIKQNKWIDLLIPVVIFSLYLVCVIYLFFDAGINDWNFKNTNVKHAVLIDAPYNQYIRLCDIIESSNKGELQSATRNSSLLGFYNEFILYKK